MWLIVTGLERLNKLQVLNLSYNDIALIDGLSAMVQLKALVLSNNKIAVIENVGKLVNLNSLILSHNMIEEIAGLDKLTNLAKLALAHNRIKVIPSLQNQYLLKELRLNDNKIFKLPPSLSINVRLEVLDLGSNRLSKLEDVEPLRELKALKDLVLLGNPICKIDSYRAKIEQLIPSLFMLDRVPTSRDVRGQRKHQRKLQMRDSAASGGAPLKNIRPAKRRLEGDNDAPDPQATEASIPKPSKRLLHAQAARSLPTQEAARADASARPRGEGQRVASSSNAVAAPRKRPAFAQDNANKRARQAPEAEVPAPPSGVEPSSRPAAKAATKPSLSSERPTLPVPERQASTRKPHAPTLSASSKDRPAAAVEPTRKPKNTKQEVPARKLQSGIVEVKSSTRSSVAVANSLEAVLAAPESLPSW
jgi:hypothetical protein